MELKRKRNLKAVRFVLVIVLSIWVIAAILVADQGPVAIAVVLLAPMILGYLFLLIGQARLRRHGRHETQERRLPLPPWVLATPSFVAVGAIILRASGHRGVLTLVIFFLSAFVSLCMYLYLILSWRRRLGEREGI